MDKKNFRKNDRKWPFGSKKNFSKFFWNRPFRTTNDRKIEKKKFSSRRGPNGNFFRNFFSISLAKMGINRLYFDQKSLFGGHFRPTRYDLILSSRLLRFCEIQKSINFISRAQRTILSVDLRVTSDWKRCKRKKPLHELMFLFVEIESHAKLYGQWLWIFTFIGRQGGGCPLKALKPIYISSKE